MNILKSTSYPRRWWVLLAMSSALSMVVLDQTALSVALAPLQRELNLSHTGTQWVMNLYLLTLTSLMLFGGKIGDSLGHRRTFLGGILLFITTSIGNALANTEMQ